MFESFYIYDEKLCKPSDDVAGGSALGATLASVLMCHFENTCLENCPPHSIPIG